MHEGGICEGVLEVVLEAAGEDPVKRVSLVVGREQAIVKDSFEFHWEMVAADTPAASAVIDFRLAPGRELVIEEIELEDGTVLRNPTVAHTH